MVAGYGAQVARQRCPILRASVAQCSMRSSIEQSAGVPPMPDPLSERYRELLEGSYDGVDRIVLNAYFRMGHSGGGVPNLVAEARGVGSASRQHPPHADGRPLQ